MKLAMVSEHASPLAVLGGVDAGGQNVHVAALSSALARRGADVSVYTRRDDPRLARVVVLEPGVRVVHVDAGPPAPVSKDQLVPFMGDFASDLLREWDADRPDVAHAHFWMSGRAAVDAGRRLGVPVVQTFHALGVVKHRHQGRRDTSPAERIATERHLLAAVDHVVATCSDEVFELVRMGGDPHRMSVVPCGVDVSRFCPEGASEARHRGLRRIVVVSRLVERKGVGNVIAALPDVPSCDLVVAGGGEAADLGRDPEVQRLHRLARHHGVADRVHLRGRVARHDLPALYRSADLVVCVPWYEPFGIVPLEAMACGVPVVASAVGGLVDTVVDGVTGVLVRPREVAPLAHAINTLLDDLELRRAMGAAACERARAGYTWEQVADASLAVYTNELSRRSPTRAHAGEHR